MADLWDIYLAGEMVEVRVVRMVESKGSCEVEKWGAWLA